MAGAQGPAAQAGRADMAAALKLVFGALLLATLAVLAAAAWRRDLQPLAPPGAAEGALLSVLLVNGQIYYGNLRAADARSISLDNVYYVQPDVDASGVARGNRLVRRQRTDWHAPVRMTIPGDKIMMVEQVGPGSRLQQLIATDSAGAASAPR